MHVVNPWINWFLYWWFNHDVFNFSFIVRIASIDKNIGIYLDFSADNGNRYSQITSKILEVDCKVRVLNGH